MTWRQVFFWLALICLVPMPIVFAEFALRRTGLGMPIRYETNAAFRYAPLPNQQVERWGAAVSVDAHGLRGTEPWATPADLHVLFVGDSVTWGGTHMDDAALFSSLACDELELQLKLRVVCGNAGVNNYGTDNMRTRLRYDRAIVDLADVIVVTIVAEDTRRGLSDLQSRYFYSSVPPGPLPAIAEALGFVLHKMSWRIRHHDLRYDASYDVELGLTSLDLLLDELSALLDAGKVTLLVFSPTFRDLQESQPNLNRAVRERIASSKMPSLDLVHVVKDLDPAEGVRAADLYADGMHLTADGHRFYGRWIGGALAIELARGPKHWLAGLNRQAAALTHRAGVGCGHRATQGRHGGGAPGVTAP